MRNILKKAAAIILAVSTAFSLISCGGNANMLPGTGEPGDSTDYDWERFDELTERANAETDMHKRALLLHEAEDMLMDTGCIIPLFRANSQYLQKTDIEGVYATNDGKLHIRGIRHTDPSLNKSISVNVCTEVPHMDPVGGTTADLTTISYMLYGQLYEKNEEGGFTPSLAESHTVSEDGCTYEFKMRDGLKWSDGSDLDAKDFEYSWKRAANTENALEYGSVFDCISGYPNNLDVKASDDGKTFTVHLNNPCSYFLELCSFTPYSVVKQSDVENAPGYKDASGNIISATAWAKDGNVTCSGPYILKEWKHNERVTFVKNPYYFDAEHIYAEEINMMLSSDSASTNAAFQRGDIVLQKGNIPSDIVPTLKDTPEYHVIKVNTTTSIIFNIETEIFSGMTAQEAATMRKAIGWAIDRNFLHDGVLSGVEDIALSYVPGIIHDGTGKTFAETEGYSYPEGDGYYTAEPDLDRAREMLESIGFEFGKDGKLKNPITIEYLYASNAPLNEMIAVSIQADLAQLGINLALSTREWTVFIGELHSGQYECGRDAWSSDYDDPYGMLMNFLSDSTNNSANIRAK